MGGKCKSLCITKHKTYAMPGSVYKNKPKCNVCCVRIEWDGIYCPCCGYKLSRRVKKGEREVKRI